jgi:hypothetical protein
MRPTVGLFAVLIAVSPLLLMVLSVVAGRSGDSFAQAWSALGALMIWLTEWVLLEVTSGHAKTMLAIVDVAAVGCVLLIGYALIPNRYRNLKGLRGKVGRFGGNKINRELSGIVREQDGLRTVSMFHPSVRFPQESDLKIYFDTPTWNRANVANRDE